MTHAPSTAVCVPVYNKAEYIGRTIQSVLDQSHCDFELVVLDNQSTDGSYEVATSFDDPRLRVIRNDRWLPAAVNFNAVVAASSAPLVKLLCADDVLLPGCLDRQVAALSEDAELALVVARQDYIDGDDAVIATQRSLRSPRLLGRQDPATVTRYIARHGKNPVGAPGSVLFRRSAFDAVGGFRTSEFLVADVDLWLRLLREGDYLGMPESLAAFRFPSGVRAGYLDAGWVRTHRSMSHRLRRDAPGQVRRRDIALGTARMMRTFARHNVEVATSRLRTSSYSA